MGQIFVDSRVVVPMFLKLLYVCFESHFKATSTDPADDLSIKRVNYTDLIQSKF